MRLGWVVVVLLALATPARGGGLSFIGRVRDGADGVDGLAGAFALAVSPDGAQVYVVGAEDDAVVQLLNTESGVCWEATYADPITNDSERFRSESD